MKSKMKQTHETLAKNCKHLKTIAEASDQLVGKKSGVSAKTVNNLTNPNSNPTLDSIIKMATAFGVEPWQLLHDDFVSGIPSARSIEEFSKELASLSDEEYAAVLRGSRLDA